jgi:cell division inhibitor SepF
VAKLIANPEVVFSSPKNIDEASYISDCIRQNKAVLVILEDVETRESQRIMDFISGVAHSADGDVTQATSRVFLVSPNSFAVSEQFSEQLRAGNIFAGFGLKSATGR